MACLCRHKNVDSFITEDPPHLVRDVRILSAGELRSILDDRNAATEAAICLRHFEADIPAAEDDQMLRHIVEFERLDVCMRCGRIEARHARNCCVRSDIEENLIA